VLRLLGPVEPAGAEATPGSPRQRLLLAALAVDVDRPVPVEVLVDRLWGTEPPARAQRTLHAYLTRTRRVVERMPPGPDGAVRVERSLGGYRLRLAPARVDLHLFRDLVARSRSASCPPAQRIDLLRAALELWRGQPLAGLDGCWAHGMREAWRQERLGAVVAWADAELAGGDPQLTLAALTDLAAEHPLAEQVAGALMRVLAALGRPAEALRRYQQTRHQLAEELGADPGPELAAVHLAVLRGVPAGTAPGPVAAPPANHRPGVPAQLPLDLAGFTGRDRELSTLDEMGSAAVPATMVALLSGTAGVGKTALAVHWAHRVVGRYPDGQLYVDLRGFDPRGPAADTTEVLRGFLTALGVPEARVPPDADGRAALYRSTLSGRRVLLVADNARDTEQVRPLLPGTPGCAVLVTSRNRLAGLVLRGARPVLLEPLPDAQARDLLTYRLGAARVAVEPAAVAQIVARCGRLPLALSIVAARAAYTRFPLAALVAELDDAGAALDPFAGDEPAGDIRTVFSWSYRDLRTPTARLFRLCGLHPGPELTAAAAASLAGIPVARAARSLADLVQANLLTEAAPGRYACHDLLRAYAAELCRTGERTAEGTAAIGRLLDHYLHSAHAAMLHLTSCRRPVGLDPPRAGVVAEAHADAAGARSWFDTERTVLLNLIRLAGTGGHDRHAWQLVWAVSPYLDVSGHWHDWVTAGGTGLAAAARSADGPAQAHLHRYLARANTRLAQGPDRDARLARAYSHLADALHWYEQAGDGLGTAETYLRLSQLRETRQEYPAALEAARQAENWYRRAGDRRGEAHALNAIGWYLALLGRYADALEPCLRAQPMLAALDARLGLADTWDSLGYIHQHLGHHRTSVDCYRTAIELYRTIQDGYDQATALHHLGQAHLAAGEPVPAGAAWREALAILDPIGHPLADEVRAALAGLDQAPVRPAGSSGPRPAGTGVGVRA